MIKESDVRELNPWWKDWTLINDDKKIKEWENSVIKYDPRLRHKITYNFEPANTIVYTLRGPRQVGKTTLVKLQIKEFLENKVSPWNILYYSLDLASTQQDVVDVIEIYMKISERQRKDNRNYLFLDEASSVSDWQKGIKWLVDTDKLKNCTVMATGSQAINIKNATERLPGRKGSLDENYDKILLPMKFVEYASLLNKDIKKFIEHNFLLSSEKRKSIFLKLINKEIDEQIDGINAYQNELNHLLYDYMLTGGTPKVIDEKLKTNSISENTYTNYLDGFKGEWSALSKNETLLKQFSGAIMKSLSTHISWNDLAKNAALGSSNTATDYAYVLRDLFVLTIMHLYGEEKKIPLIQKDRKFYFHDPFFLHVFNGWLSAKGNFETSLKYIEDEINQSKIVEGIVADHLIRWAFMLSNKKQTFDYYNHLFYWKDDKGREVDFILYDGNSIEVPIEVKYRNKIDHKELAGLVNFLSTTGKKSGIVISKTDLEIRSEYVIIPASVFLMLI
ncbi:MAG: ATP-binding protein [Nitrosotalea sp.]